MFDRLEAKLKKIEEEILQRKNGPVGGKDEPLSNKTDIISTNASTASVVVDVEYESKEFGPLPIDLFAKSKAGKG